MKIVEKLKIGDFASIKGKIQKSIAWHHKEFDVKVGITSNPQKRASSYRSSESYDKMVVLYKSSSQKEIRQLEKYLVERNWEIVDNEIGGGGGPLGEDPYFLYIVCKKRPSLVRNIFKAAMIVGGTFLGVKLLTSTGNGK